MMIRRIQQIFKPIHRAVDDAVHLYSPALTKAEKQVMIHRRNHTPEYDASFISAHQVMAALDEWADELADDLELNAYVDNQGPLPQKYTRKRVWPGFAVAATAILAITSGFYIHWKDTTAPADVMRYVTRVGEQRDLELADGSIITLNTSSQILVDMTADQRRVVMDRGEAYFKVAKDPLRPFSVEVEGRAISVLGTEFSLRRSANGFSLALTEGVLAIHRQGEELAIDAPALQPTADNSIQVGLNEQRRIFAGTVVKFDALNQQLIAQYDPEIKRQQLWRKGLLSFRNKSLKQVVEELNRYSAKPIFLEGQGLEQLKVFATFKIHRIDMALQGLENSAPIKVVPYTDRIVVVRRDSTQ